MYNCGTDQLRTLLLAIVLVVAITVIALCTVAAYDAFATGPCSPTTVALDADERQFLVLLNQYRVANSAGPLSVSPGLTRAAAWMAEDLTAHNYFSHIDTLGRLPWDRVLGCGYPSQSVGENIAGGTASAAGVLAQWKSSPGHNANMLNPNWRVIGIARVPGGVYGGWTWVIDLGIVNDGEALPSSSTPPSTATPRLTPTPVIHRLFAPGLARDR